MNLFESTVIEPGHEAAWTAGAGGDAPIRWSEVFAALRDRTDEAALPLVEAFVQVQGGSDGRFGLDHVAGGLDAGRTLMRLASELKKTRCLDVLADGAKAAGINGRAALTGGSRLYADVGRMRR